MGSHFYEFTAKNRWILLITLICVIFVALASYSIEEDRKNILASMESQTKIEALNISMGLGTELDEVTRDLLVTYDAKQSSPPKDQDEFSFKAKTLLKKYPFLSSIYYIDTEQNLTFKLPASSNDLPNAYGNNSSILEIAMIVADHTDKPYLSRPYEVTSGNYQYSLMIPYEEHSFFQLTFTCEDIFAQNSAFRQNNEIFLQVTDDQKVVYTSQDYELELEQSDRFLSGSQMKLYNREMLLYALPSDTMLSAHLELWETFGHGSLYLILFILLLIVLFQMFDISERKENERKLELSEKKFKSIFNNVNDAIYINDLKGNFLEVNNVLCETLGYTKEELLKMHRWEIMLHNSPIKTEKRINAVFNSKEVFSETVHVSRRGTLIPVELSSRLIDYEGQKAIINIARDLSESKRAEMLRKSNEELIQLTRMKDLFTDILRHDLLGPASVMKGFTEFLLDNTEDHEKKHMLEKIYNNNRKLIEMIDNAAKLAKLESIEELDFETVDLFPLMSAVVDRYQAQLQAKGISLKVPPKKEYNALINPIIAEAFANILSNAIKYSPADSEIVIVIEDTGTNWKILVTDSGEGVQVDDREQIFDRFSRAHKGGVKGSGLGLAIAKRIIDLHGGSIAVTSNPAGKGSVFWFCIKKGV